MKKVLKVFLIVVGIILAATLIFALINYKSVLLALGIGKLDVKTYDEAKATFEQSELYNNIQVQNDNGATAKTISGSTKDGAVDFDIQGEADGAIAKVDAKIHGGMMKDINPTDVNALAEKAKTYLSPFISDDQVLGLSGFIAKEALEQYNQGNTRIKIEKDFNGIQVSIEGDINTEEFTAEIINK